MSQQVRKTSNLINPTIHRKYDRKNDLLNCEARLISLLNITRMKNDVPSLSRSEALTAAALRHAKDLAFGIRATLHTGSDRSSVADRVKQAGYNFRYVCENVGRGQRSPQHIVNSWMRDPLRRQGVMTGLANQVGVAVMEDEDGRACWVMVVGKQKSLRRAK